jgi:hypothetical protein
MAAVAANPRAWLNIAEIEEGDDDRAAVRPGYRTAAVVCSSDPTHDVPTKRR